MYCLFQGNALNYLRRCYCRKHRYRRNQRREHGWQGGVSQRKPEHQQGDARHLDFPDETFDAVTSNYVYHNITGADKQALLRESLRVLKRGGVFAIHDLMEPSRYGDMDEFLRKLREDGFQEAQLLPTADGSFMTPWEGKTLFLSGSALLVGRK